MNEQKITEANKIIKKITNTPIMARFALLVSIFFLGICIYGLITIKGDSAAIVFIVLGGLLSLTCFLIFFFSKKKSKIKY